MVYTGGPHVITLSFKNGREADESERCVGSMAGKIQSVRGTQPTMTDLEDGGRKPQAKECGDLWEQEMPSADRQPGNWILILITTMN